MMKLLLRSLLLCSLCSWGVSSVNEFPVTQTPDVTAMEGETVHIHCCWNRSFQRGRVNWLKNTKEMNEQSTVQTLFIKNYRCQTDQGNVACNCSMLTLSNVARNDSATYICKVSIDLPVLCQSEGDGTRITVTARPRHDTTTDVYPTEIPDSDDSNLVIFVVRCLISAVILGAVMCSLFCYYKWKLNKLILQSIEEMSCPGQTETSV